MFVYRGSGEDGQLGLGTYEEKEWACVVEALDPFAVRSVVGGSRNSLAICDDGTVIILISYIWLYSNESFSCYNWSLCILGYVL